MIMNLKNDATIGFLLALTTAVLWGTVPIAVREIVPNMSPVTLVWYRFILSFSMLFIILAAKHQLPQKKQFMSSRVLLLLFIATLGLAGNFTLFSAALIYISPTVTQVVAQLSSVGLLLAGLIIFKERLKPSQVVGVIILIIGLGLFFNTSIIEILTELTTYSKGVLLAMCAATVWVIYGLAQKILLKDLKSPQILLILYLGCLVLLLPFAKLTEIMHLSPFQLILLGYCGINTIVGYGALAEAMNRWQVSQVSAMITLTPLFTLIFSDILALLWPQIFLFPELNLLGYIGAFVVVAGAMFTAVGHHVIKRRKNQTSP